MKTPRYFQWIQGDSIGNVETLKSIECIEGEYFYNFNSGEKCNVEFIAPMSRDPRSLKNKAMVEIINPSDKWRFEEITTKTYTYMDPTAGEQTVEYPPLEDIVGASGSGETIELKESALGKMRYIPPRFKGPYKPLPSYEEYRDDNYYEASQPSSPNVQFIEKEVPAPTKKEEQPKEVISQPVESIPAASIKANTVVYNNTGVNNDPVYILAKTCKKHDTEINLTLHINLPSKSIFDLAENEFDNGGQKFVSYLVDEIDPSIILTSLKGALLDSYGS